ncbi:MAG TPA: hypothetical protein VJ787_10495 [Thermoleophilia bacterium]|nr:hypothetical protein [Thermoleophilia bacterium]
MTLLTLLVLLVALMLATAGPAAAKRGPDGISPTLTTEEKTLLSSLDDDYAWQVMLKQVYGWGVPNYDPWFNETVGGTEESHVTVQALAAEMQAIGLEPGAKNGTYIEDFPIDGWEDIGSSATIVSPYTKTISPTHQVF